MLDWYVAVICRSKQGQACLHLREYYVACIWEEENLIVYVYVVIDLGEVRHGTFPMKGRVTNVLSLTAIAVT